MGQVTSTAILIFSNSSEQESGHKQDIYNKYFFEALNNRTLKIVGNTGLLYFQFTERTQKGDSFKVRFVNALERVFEMGFGNVITVGNDTPRLRTSNLHRENMELKSNMAIPGPSADGEIYLIGIHKSIYKPTEFRQLPWQSFNP